MLLENEIPEDIQELLADFEFVLESRGYSAKEQIRFMGLFMYKRIKECGRTIPNSVFVKMISALNRAHERAWKISQ